MTSCRSQPFADLDLAMKLGWDDTPGLKLPRDWRTRKKGLVSCVVDGCRMECRTIPENVEALRGNGECLCFCGEKLKAHEAVAYPTGMGHCVCDCEGVYWHL